MSFKSSNISVTINIMVSGFELEEGECNIEFNKLNLHANALQESI